ncbi:MAG TPA: transglycosylase SLT domain-containing protein [Bdellovibrionota bacterium]
MALATLASCASWRANFEGDHRDPAAATAATGSATATLSDSPAEINKIIEETNPVLSEFAGENEKVPLQIPIEINRRVAGWLKYFTERERAMTTRYLERGEALRPHIEAILRENEVPAELFYLAMIESGFVISAKSRAKAVGIWQFVKGTGKNYRMVINKSVDERRNWIKATEAAANYLKDLNNVFGSWYLALAAYNAGEHRIVRSIMKGKTRDFWVLAERGLLPQETMDYVPKFLAAHIVGKNYERLGFKLNIGPEDKWDDWDTVSVPSGVRLSDIARKSSIPLAVLKRWNRDLIHGVTPYSRNGTVDIYLPKTEVAKFDTLKEQIENLKRFRHGWTRQQMADATNAADDGSYDFYVVRRGDNLASISRRIGISTRTLMKINGLRRGRIHPGQRLKFYAPPTAAAEGGKPKSSRPRDRVPADELK